MVCGNCGKENRGGAVFCDGCGTRLAQVCASCGTELRSGARFCDSCGTPVGAAPSSTHGSPASPRAAARADETFGDGRYVAGELLGEGASKLVYRADDSRLGRPVALSVIKVEGLDRVDRARVEREVQAMLRLAEQPNVVTVHDVGDDPDRPWFISELMDGGDVSGLIASSPDGRLDPRRAVEIAIDVASGLEAAHGLGILHRDLKPSNVWLTADGRAKIGDFGLAAVADHTRLTAEGTILGTAAYMPPEVGLGGAAEADERSDLYSLGAMFYEMLTGKPPFTGTMESVISQHANTPPLPVRRAAPDVPRALESIVRDLLAKSPNDRPSSAEEVVASLSAIRDVMTASPSEDLPLMPAEAEHPTFVGRSAELEELRAHVEAALGGDGGLVMLAGEPGIGKTSLADEAARYAELRGMSTLTGRCLEAEGAPAYWPWVQVVRSHLRQGDVARTAMGSGAWFIGQIVPEALEGVDRTTEGPFDPDEARFKLFDSMTTYLLRASEEKPLLLVLDDLHWADPSSLLLLELVVSSVAGSRILILGTYRDVEIGRHHPLAKILATIGRDGSGRRINLKGLDEADVATYIEGRAGHRPTDSLVAAVQRETEGNPFFVHEVVSLLIDEGRLEERERSGSLSLAIPEGVRDVVGRRLDRLTQGCNDVLTAASVVGRAFDAVVVARVSGVTADVVLDRLDEAMAAGLVETEEGGVGRYRFSHALIRETLYDEIPPGRRIRNHRAVGEAIEESFATSLDVRASELAYHFTVAAPGADEQKALKYSKVAADRSIAVTAYEDAVEILERALQLAEAHPQVAESDRCDLRIALAQALFKASGPARAREVARAAAESARALDDGPRLAEAALTFAGIWGELGVVNMEILSMLSEALDLLGDGDSVMRARVLGRLGVEYATGEVDADFETKTRRQLEVSTRAVEMALRVDDDLAMANGLIARQYALSGPEHVLERLETAPEIERLGRAAGSGDVVEQGQLWKMLGYLETARADEFDAAFAEYSARADELKQPLYVWGAALVSSLLAVLRGELDEAEGRINSALMLGQQGSFQNAAQLFGAQLLTLRREQGRLGELEPVVGGFVDQFPSVPAWRAAHANVLAASGQLEAARGAFESLAVDGFSAIPRDFNWLVSMTLLAQVAWELDHAEAAATLHDLLSPFEDLVTVLGPVVACTGAVAREIGMAASVAGRFEAAESAFEHAIQINQRLRARPFVAHCRREYAATLARRGDEARSRELAAAALSEYRELGMNTFAAQADAVIGSVT